MTKFARAEDSEAIAVPGPQVGRAIRRHEDKDYLAVQTASRHAFVHSSTTLCWLEGLLIQSTLKENPRSTPNDPEPVTSAA